MASPTSKTSNKQPNNKQHRAKHFKATRHHHSTESAEDYTELVSDLIEKTGEARTCEIAKHLGISHVTAVKTIKRLADQGYLNKNSHAPITLTAKGKKTAQFSKERHEALVDFFCSIGVPRSVAEIDVEGAEHHISETTLKHIKKFLNKK